MGTNLASGNYKVLPRFMLAEIQNSSTRQADKFNNKENKLIRDSLYFFDPLPNKLHNGSWNVSWIDENTTGVNFGVKPLYSGDKQKANVLLAVPDSRPDTVVDVKQYARLKAMLQEEITESGITNPSEKIVESIYSKDKQKAGELLNELFRKNSHTPHIAVGVLHIISHFDYDLVSPEGPAMAIAALRHKDIEVREYGVKCFENWQRKDGIGILKDTKANEKWLQNYIDLVIRDLENI